MTIEAPKISPDARLRTSQAAAALGVHRVTLRRWEAKGWISPRFCNATGRAYWRGKDLIKLWERLTA